MGYKASEWAYSLEIAPATKAVLVALAHRADDKTFQCYPGQQALASMTGASVRTVSRALNDLEAEGVIARKQRRRPGGSRTSDLCVLNRSYTTESHTTESHVTESQQTDGPKSPDTQSELTGQSGRHTEEEQSVEHSEEQSDSLESAFERFYEAYPRRQARAAALKAYTVALRTTDADTILAGARAFNLLTAGKERKYLPYPATWLNGRRWEDEPIEESPSTARTYRPTKDERALQILEMGRQLHSQSYGRPPRPSEAPPECPLHEGYSITPTSPCERCRRDQLSIPEGASF